MMAVWGLTGLAKPMVQMPQPYYDVRVLADNVKMMTGTEVTAETLSTLVHGAGGHNASSLSQMPLPTN
jgi:oleate hydratase